MHGVDVMNAHVEENGCCPAKALRCSADAVPLGANGQWHTEHLRGGRGMDPYVTRVEAENVPDHQAHARGCDCGSDLLRIGQVMGERLLK